MSNEITHRQNILAQIARERARAVKRFGAQSELPLAEHGPGKAVRAVYERLEAGAKRICESARAEGKLTWEYIIDEEWAEALAAPTLEQRREELVQLAGTVLGAIEATDIALLKEATDEPV